MLNVVEGQLREEIEELHETVIKLTRKYSEAMQQLQRFEKRNESLEKENRKLKRELKKLQKE